jgi:oligosaccharide repeat unit polymerase
MDTLINFFPSLIFLSLLYYNIKTVGRIISLSSFIILLYAVSMICFAVYSFVDETYYITFETFFLVFFSIIIFTLPLAKFEKKITSNTKIIGLNKKRYKVLVFLIISISVYSIFFFGKNLFKVFNSDLSVLKDQVLRDGGFYKSSIFSKIAVFGAYLSPITLFFYFYALLVHEDYKLRILLLISSISFIFYTLNVGGRDGIIIWMLSYVALLCLFYPLLESKIIKNQKKFLLTSMMIFLPILLIISFARFGDEGSDDSNKKVFFSMLNYIGQQPYELSERLEQLSRIDEYNGEPRSIYPLLFNFKDAFFGVVNSSDVNNKEALRSDSLALGFNTWRFVYYIGDLLTELGMVGLIIVTLIIYFICSTNLKIINDSISISRLLISFAWYMIIIVGVFYFYYGQTVGNAYLITPFLIHFFLKAKLK